MSGARYENTAEHCWSLAMATLLFADQAEVEIDLLRALKMAILHDIVEIHAGDTLTYNDTDAEDKFKRELLTFEIWQIQLR